MKTIFIFLAFSFFFSLSENMLIHLLSEIQTVPIDENNLTIDYSLFFYLFLVF